jgi:hypothetical protein
MSFLDLWRSSKDLQRIDRMRREPAHRMAAAEAEAHEQTLAKSPKLETARQAVFLQDLQELGKADRNRVDQMFQQRLGYSPAGGGGGAGDDGLIVCDDYRPTYHSPWAGVAWLLAAGIALTVVLLGLIAFAYLLNKAPNVTNNLPQQLPPVVNVPGPTVNVPEYPTHKDPNYRMTVE